MEPKFTTRKNCPVCSHQSREYIEAVLYRVTPKNSDEILQELADTYDIDVAALASHAMFHAAMDLSPAGEETSIVRQLKLREVDMLAQCAKDYADTMALIGNRIRKKAINEDSIDGIEDTRFERSMTKGLVELYLGCGDNVRKTVKDITEINQTLNGPKDEGASGLIALAKAISGSNQSSKTIFDQEDDGGEA